MKKIMIKNARMISPNRSHSAVEGSIIVEGTKIQKIVWKHEASNDYIVGQAVDEIYDAQGMVVIPGMINAHYHSYSNLLKGTINNLPLEPWSLYTVAYGHSLTEEDIRLSVLLGSIEMIRNGVTTCVDHFPHSRHILAALEAYAKSGMRVSFAPMLQDIRDDEFFNIKFPEVVQHHLNGLQKNSKEFFKSLYEQLAQDWHNKFGRIQICLGPNAPQRCSTDMLTLCRKLSERYDLNIHMHLLETSAQQKRIKEIYPEGIVSYLDRLGLLSSKLSVAHAVWLEDHEIDQLSANEVSIVHNPASNLVLGSGIAPVNAYLDQGMNVALGTDASNCGSSHNLFEAMRLAAMIHRPSNINYSKWIGEAEVFHMATQAGAKTLGLEDHLGKIAPGYTADIVLLQASNTTWSPINNLLSQLVFQENGSSVHSVMVNGEWVLKEGKMLKFNENDILSQVKERRKKMMDQSKQKIDLAKVQEPYFVTAWRR